MKKIENKYLKQLFIFLGFLSLVLGGLGIFLPLLPTTPFLLLTAYFFSKSSEKFYNMLLNNKVFGKYIKNFREGKGISMKTKVVSIFTLWLAIGTTVLFFIEKVPVQILLIVIGLSVSYYLSSLKTLKD